MHPARPVVQARSRRCVRTVKVSPQPSVANGNQQQCSCHDGRESKKERDFRAPHDLDSCRRVWRHRTVSLGVEPRSADRVQQRDELHIGFWVIQEERQSSRHCKPPSQLESVQSGRVYASTSEPPLAKERKNQEARHRQSDRIDPEGPIKVAGQGRLERCALHSHQSDDHSQQSERHMRCCHCSL
jgi:hypothetical protein